MALKYDRHEKFQIWSLCYNLILSYAHNRHRHTDQTLEMWFSDSGELKTCKVNQNLNVEILTSKSISFTIHGEEKELMLTNATHSKKYHFSYCRKN